MDDTIIVIGGLSAGPSAAAKARRTNEHARIILFEKTRHISYATCGIPYTLSGTINHPDKLMMVKAELLEKRFNIEVKLEEEVLDILPDEHIIHSSKGLYKYSKLIYAAGAKPFVPPVKNLENAFNWSDCRTIENFNKLVEDGVLTTHKHITILGAGLIGVEVAENLNTIGKNVTIIEQASSILGQWDKKFGGMAAGVLRSKGIRIFTNATITNVKITDREIKSVLLDDGTRIKTDYLILGIGGRPNTQMLASKGAACLDNGAIKVNERMETSLPDIYAAGDCASLINLQTGMHDYFPMGTHSNKGGRTAGANAAGGNATFKGAYKTAIVKVFEHTLGRTGMNARMLKQHSIPFKSVFFVAPATPGFFPDSTDLMVELFYRTQDRVLLGAEIFGERGVDKRIDVLSTAIFARLSIDDLPDLDLAYAPPYSPARDAVILGGYIASHGAQNAVSEISVEELQKRINAGSNGYSLIDVRNSTEIEASGQIPGAIHIELDELRHHLPSIDPESEVIVYCAKGLRGYVAGTILANNNYKKVFNLGGGFKAWQYFRDTNATSIDPLI